MSVKIIDATLREGCQCPGVDFNAAQSLEIARMLAALKVDMIECGHPLKSAVEAERVRTLVNAGLNVPILAHSRAKQEDIAAVAGTGAEWIGIFLGINHTTRTARLRDCTVDDILRYIRESVTYAKSLGLKVRYTVEDGCRTNMFDLQKAYAAAVDAGADRICFADTLGVMEPHEMSHVVRTIKSLFPAVDMEIHVHDDRGLAMAVSLAAMDAGANWISTSVNGIGERCGITDTLSMIANLHHRRQRNLRDLSCNLVEVSQLVERLSGAAVDPRRPIAGANAFAHKARLHRLAIERDSGAYSWIEPSLVGAELSFVEE